MKYIILPLIIFGCGQTTSCSLLPSRAVASSSPGPVDVVAVLVGSFADQEKAPCTFNKAKAFRRYK